MQKGDIYELNHWFEGEQTDWCIFIAQEDYSDAAFFGEGLHLHLGNILVNSLEEIEQNMVYCSLEDLKDALMEVNTEEYWDDDIAQAKVAGMLQELDIEVAAVEAEEVVL